MRASRLLSILMLLQSHGRMTAPALASQLEVAERTILRDMDHLSAAGIPVWSDRGRDGGFQLRAGWSTQLTGLTATEAQALFLAGLPDAATELGLGAASASAQLKMLAALPADLRNGALRVGARLHVDPLEWYRANTPSVHLQAVAHAVWNQRVLDMAYESWSGARTHTVKPLGLVLKAGTWYLAALPSTSKQARIYRLSNIQTIDLQDAFRRPRNFNLAAFWQSATQRFEGDIYRDQASLRVTPRGMKLLRDLSARVAAAASQSAQPDPLQPHWTQVVVPIESVSHAAHQLLGLGTDVEVVGPAALRRQMRDKTQAMAALYA